MGKYLAVEIAQFGPFRIIYDGDGGIPGLCWELKDPASSSFTLYDYADRLRERGWLVPAYSMPAAREDLVIQRILVRHGFTREMAEQLLVEMKSVLDDFAKVPPQPVELVGAVTSQHDHSGR